MQHHQAEQMVQIQYLALLLLLVVEAEVIHKLGLTVVLEVALELVVLQVVLVTFHQLVHHKEIMVALELVLQILLLVVGAVLILLDRLVQQLLGMVVMEPHQLYQDRL
jgi:hypothetical protein